MTAIAAHKGDCVAEAARNFGNCLESPATFLPIKQLMAARIDALALIAKYAKSVSSRLRNGYGPLCANRSEVEEWIQVVETTDFLLDSGFECGTTSISDGIISIASRSCNGASLGNGGILIDKSGVDEFFEKTGYKSYEPWEAALLRPTPEIALTITELSCNVVNYVVKHYEALIQNSVDVSYKVTALPYTCALNALATVSKNEECIEYDMVGVNVVSDYGNACEILVKKSLVIEDIERECMQVGLTVSEAQSCSIAVATFSKLNTGVTECNLDSVIKVAQAVKCGVDAMSAAALWNVGVEVQCSETGVQLVADGECSTLENLKVAVRAAKDYLQDEH